MLRNLIRDTLYRATATRAGFPDELAEKWLELTRLRHFLTTHAIDVVIDVGANEGQFAAKLRRLGYTGTIVSFEPDPRAFATLSRNREGDKKWRGYGTALGDENGSLSFHLAKESVLSSARLLIREQNVVETVTVPVRRLDDAWGEITTGRESPRVLLKTDTQGFDLNVLRGATGILHHVRGVLAELSVLPIYRQTPSLAEALEAYQQSGFDLVHLSTVNQTPDGRLLELDGLFVNRGTMTTSA